VQENDDDTLLQAGKSSDSCKLPPPVQELMQLIFDVNLMKQVMMEFEVGERQSVLTVRSFKSLK
jgi:hypothetical protein